MQYDAHLRTDTDGMEVYAIGKDISAVNLKKK
jgi:hypothetical protein